MHILIPGADGMVARALAAHCRELGDNVTALTRHDLDITDSDAVFRKFAELKPGAVINCAAFTDVDGAESNIDKCYAVNATGVENMALAAANLGIKFVTISTDYVFDGEKDGFYTETDEAVPLGIYARSKLEGERLALAADPNAIVVRSGWIYGAGGKNFLSVMNSLLKNGKAITAINDSLGTPTNAADLSQRLRELAASAVTGIIHVTNEGSGTTYFGFAEKICELGGYGDLVTPVTNDSLQRPAPRPKNSRIATTRREETGLGALPDWIDSLQSFLDKENKADA